MLLFVLGIVLGFGLSQMLHSISKSIQLKKINKAIDEERAFNERVKQAISLANSGWDTQTTEPTSARPAGPSDW